MRILHLITDLNQGGAEIVLSRLLPSLREMGCEQWVVCLRERGVIGAEIESTGFEVEYLDMKPSVPSLSAIQRIVKCAKAFQPDLMQSWMYHADYYSCLAHPFLRIMPVVWGLHNSTLSNKSNPLTRGIARRLAYRSKTIPSAIISCSHEAIMVHEGLGYSPDKMRYVPNGFDTELFKPNLMDRMELRSAFGIQPDQTLVGCIARFDQQKNHHGLIECWKRLGANDPEMRFLLAGKGLDDSNQELLDWLETAGIRERTLLLGMRSDVPRLLNALDLFVLASNSGEAFPLIIGEAMSSETLCAVTNVGDTAVLLGQCGAITPADDPDSQAEACKKLLNASLDRKKELKRLGRERILNNYSLQNMANGYYAVYQEVLSHQNRVEE